MTPAAEKMDMVVSKNRTVQKLRRALTTDGLPFVHADGCFEEQSALVPMRVVAEWASGETHILRGPYEIHIEPACNAVEQGCGRNLKMQGYL